VHWRYLSRFDDRDDVDATRRHAALALERADNQSNATICSRLSTIGRMMPSSPGPTTATASP
jgi:hypothetical protein